MSYQIRKFISCVEEVHHDGGPAPAKPLIKAAVGVIVRNPFVGQYVDDLSALTDPSPELGQELGRRAALLLGDRPVEGYGKGGIAGTNGEQEHVVACVTTLFGDAFRESVGGGKAWISSVTKVAGPGAAIDIPLAYKDAVYVRSHYDAISLASPDAPRPDELLIAVAVSSGGRIHQRSGGLSVAEALGDGVR